MSAPKRKQNFVDSSVQGGLIRRILFHWVMFFAVTTCAVLSLKTLLGDPSEPLGVRLQQELGEFSLLAIIFVAIFPAFMLDTIRFSNRFVGPVARLRRHLQELGTTGETSDIKFRDNDFWQEIAKEFNTVNAMIKQQKSQIADQQEQDKTTSAV